MEQMCFMIPILPGKTEAARQYIWEMGHDRWADYDRSQRRVGISNESWFLTSLPSGDYFVLFVQSTDFARTLAMLVQSDDEYDCWFKQGLIDVAGLDLNNPLEMRFPELLLTYAAA